MPLIKSGGKAAVGMNIKEMMASGRPQKQAVAAALDNQRRSKAQGFNKGGVVEPSTENAIKQNLVEACAMPTGPVGLEKGGTVRRGGWKRWGQK